VLWFTTRNGVYKHHIPTKTTTELATYSYRQLDTWNYWNSISEDVEGNVWIANNFRGMLKFTNGGDTPKRVEISNKIYSENHGSAVTLTQFTIDKSGIFWFGTREHGIMKFNPSSKLFTLIKDYGEPDAGQGSQTVFGLASSTSDSNRVYVGLYGKGFSTYDTETFEFTNYSFKSQAETFPNSVRSILETKDGELLIGTWGDGLLHLDKSYKEIKRFISDPAAGNFPSNQVRVLKQGQNETIWAGTTNGLAEVDLKSGAVKIINALDNRKYPDKLTEKVYAIQESDAAIALLQAGDFAALSAGFVLTDSTDYLIAMMGEGLGVMVDYGFITSNENDTIWSGIDISKTFHAGGDVKNRNIYDIVKLGPGAYTLHYISDDSHSYNSFNAIVPDFPEYYGIAIAPINEKADIRLEAFSSNLSGNNFLSSSGIKAIAPSGKYLWVGTEIGLNKLDTETGNIEIFKNDNLDENSICNNVINCLNMDRFGMLWIGTEDGLDQYDPKTGIFTHYTISDGLPTNQIAAIVNGDDGELWFSTYAGLTRMVRNEKLGKFTFINYRSNDGLGGESFVPLVGTRSLSGTFCFGHEMGLVVFNRVEGSSEAPDILLSKFLVSNRPFAESEAAPEKPIAVEAIESLLLTYDQNDLSFEFTALHYANPSKNQYAHMLKGLEDDWIYDNRNFASYTNLEPGEYEFMMRASNSYGVWNEEGKTIKITILPPWWRTWWAYAGYALALVLLIIGVDRVLRKRIALREEQKNKDRDLAQAKEIEKAYHKLEEAHEDLKSAQEQLVQQEKLASLGQLTAGIAHEIKNPLNFVNNFSELSIELVDELSESLKDEPLKGKRGEIDEYLNDIKANLSKILQHGTRADGIVKSMLQHSRGGSGKMEPTDLNALITEFVNLAFHGMRASKNPISVKLDFDLDENLGSVNLIGEDFSRVVLNLTNNAFDAMREKTKTDPNYKPLLTATSKRLGDRVTLSIADNGSGIPEAIKDKILQPFFTTKKGTDGTGLGLSITNDIIKAHGGTLSLPETAQGAVFKINLAV
jgi:signal transduction histidine kinase/streptogramin lyase